MSMSWIVKDNKLHKKFVFDSFKQAFEFMTNIAAMAEELNHHPDWCNYYNQVIIDLFTHSQGKITEKDYQLAKRIDAVFDKKVS